MSKFDDCLKPNNLGASIETQYGQWGHFTEEAANLIVDIAKNEASFQVDSNLLMAMLAVTWMNESTFNLAPVPNENKKRWNPWNFDVGPFQLNVQWTMRMAWQGDFQTKDLVWKEVFGPSFYDEDGVTPCTFKGNPLTHGRCAARRLLSYNVQPGPLGFADKETMQVVRFTGPKAQSHRLKDWQKYGELFKQFFECYLT